MKDEQRVVKVLAGSRRPRPEEVELENKDPPNRSQRKKTLRHVKKKQEPKVSPPKSSLVEDTKVCVHGFFHFSVNCCALIYICMQ